MMWSTAAEASPHALPCPPPPGAEAEALVAAGDAVAIIDKLAFAYANSSPVLDLPLKYPVPLGMAVRKNDTALALR